MLKSFAKTHIGQRHVNEDAYLIDENFGLYIVADGVGGLEKGDVASTLACQAVLDNIKAGTSLKESIYQAHRLLVKEAQGNLDRQGMATTIVAALFNGNSYEIAWVGDSRAYIWDNELKLITKDDSYVQLLYDNGHISLDEIENHPDRNIISQALGIERKEITINVNSGTLNKNQILLLCSDGLYSIANEKNIIASIKESNRVEYIASTLVNMAVEKEGKDNITLIAIKSVSKNILTKNIQQPKIYRKFDTRTGKISNIFVTASEKKSQASLSESDTLSEDEQDPNKVDQTSITDLSEDDFKLLETAAGSKEVHSSQKNNYVLPTILMLVLVIIAAVLLLY